MAGLSQLQDIDSKRSAPVTPVLFTTFLPSNNANLTWKEVKTPSRHADKALPLAAPSNDVNS